LQGQVNWRAFHRLPELDNPGVIDIPVSKTYVNSVMHTFSKYCQTNDRS
jgi:hypothetical protein